MCHIYTLLLCILMYREGHESLVDEVHTQLHAQLRDVTPDLVVLSVGGGGLMNGVLDGMHKVGWTDVPVLAVETEGTCSLNACAQAGEWVGLDEITGYILSSNLVHLALIKHPLLCSIAVCLGVRKVSKRSYEWLSQHPIIPCTVTDREAVSACINMAGRHSLWWD